jgi:hypothetical protein
VSKDYLSFKKILTLRRKCVDMLVVLVVLMRGGERRERV